MFFVLSPFFKHPWFHTQTENTQNPPHPCFRMVAANDLPSRQQSNLGVEVEEPHKGFLLVPRRAPGSFGLGVEHHDSHHPPFEGKVRQHLGWVGSSKRGGAVDTNGLEPKWYRPKSRPTQPLREFPTTKCYCGHFGLHNIRGFTLKRKTPKTHLILVFAWLLQMTCLLGSSPISASRLRSPTKGSYNQRERSFSFPLLGFTVLGLQLQRA